MDCTKVGKLILQLRTEKGLTQKQVADRLNITNKTISKWEQIGGGLGLGWFAGAGTGGLPAALGAGSEGRYTQDGGSHQGRKTMFLHGDTPFY